MLRPAQTDGSGLPDGDLPGVTGYSVYARLSRATLAELQPKGGLMPPQHTAHWSRTWQPSTHALRSVALCFGVRQA